MLSRYYTQLREGHCFREKLSIVHWILKTKEEKNLTHLYLGQYDRQSKTCGYQKAK